MVLFSGCSCYLFICMFVYKCRDINIEIYKKIKKQKDKYFIAFLLSYLFIFLIKNV